jgi:putative FmdB family regulatory protein
MPIYAYKCGSCGHAKDVLQKLSDPPLADCPVCGAAAFSKQVTAAGFQLKGSGWYATDFKGGSKGAPAADGAKGADGAKPADGAAKPAEGAAKPSESGGPAPTTKPDAPAASAGGCGGSCACH